MPRALPDVSFAVITDPTRRHAFFWAAPTADFEDLLDTWNRDTKLTARPFTFAEPAIVAEAQEWLADRLQEHDKATVMIGSIEAGRWVNWNLPAIPRPAVPTY
ncbi:hypothetical protein [Streptomyces sp. NPDC059122]|uniref:hypothetical protein n=1 Tax=Streptomyces sp. NPDC059122 TaxID=3346732 RepID=UPI0036AEC357